MGISRTPGSFAPTVMVLPLLPLALDLQRQEPVSQNSSRNSSTSPKPSRRVRYSRRVPSCRSTSSPPRAAPTDAATPSAAKHRGSAPRSRPPTSRDPVPGAGSPDGAAQLQHLPRFLLCPWKRARAPCHRTRPLRTRSRCERSRCRGLVTIAWVLEAVVGSSGQRERAPLPLFGCRVAQIWGPAVADIIGARRAWTVAMISSVSMHLVPELGVAYSSSRSAPTTGRRTDHPPDAGFTSCRQSTRDDRRRALTPRDHRPGVRELMTDTFRSGAFAT
jgi:hypothetical protein